MYFVRRQLHAQSCASIADEAHEERMARRCLLLLFIGLEARIMLLWFTGASARGRCGSIYVPVHAL